mmetsp:Transcript_7918/g.19268  ORF Transcript_7918/g.19268 Transcript_7918/m.19268 type:complete len:162 (-) Transcript_7918:1333-1818(-)
MEFMMMQAAQQMTETPSHCQTFAAVFVVDRVVLKMYASEAAMTPAAKALTRETFLRLVCVAVATTRRGLGLRPLPVVSPLPPARAPRAAPASQPSSDGALSDGALASVRGLNPALAKSFFDQAVRARDARPWDGSPHRWKAFKLGVEERRPPRWRTRLPPA